MCCTAGVLIYGAIGTAFWLQPPWWIVVGLALAYLTAMWATQVYSDQRHQALRVEWERRFADLKRDFQKVQRDVVENRGRPVVLSIPIKKHFPGGDSNINN